MDRFKHEEVEKRGNPEESNVFGGLVIGGTGALHLKNLAKDPHLLDGRTTVYHGTSEAAAKKIREEGVKGKYTAVGSPEAKSITQILPKDVVEKSKGLSFMTKNDAMAAVYALQHNDGKREVVQPDPFEVVRRMRSKEGIVKARLPSGKYEKRDNPEFLNNKAEYLSKKKMELGGKISPFQE